MFLQKTEVQKASLLGQRLVGGASEVASTFMEELGKQYNVVLRDEASAPQFIIEVLVFYMHLVDRSTGREVKLPIAKKTKK